MTNELPDIEYYASVVPHQQVEIAQVAPLLGISRAQLRNMCRRGTGPANVRINYRCWLMRWIDVKNWLDSKRAASTTIKSPRVSKQTLSDSNV